MGDKGKLYDNWVNNQIADYYLSYNENLYIDSYKFSIERDDCGASEQIFLANDINEIIDKIDKEIKREQIQSKKQKQSNYAR